MVKNQLSHLEIEKINRACSQKENCVCTAIAEVYITLKPDHNNFIFLLAGVACLIRNLKLKYHKIKVFSLETNQFVFEEDFYLDINFNVYKSHFVQFEGKYSMIGFNFSDIDEAIFFCERLNKAKDKDIIYFADLEKSLYNKNNKNFKNNKSKHNITKDIIGCPFNLKTISTIDIDRIPGFDTNNGSNIDHCSKQWKEVFEHLNLSKEVLSDLKLLNKIVSLIMSYGGIEKIYKSMAPGKPIKNIQSETCVTSNGLQKKDDAAYSNLYTPMRPLRFNKEQIIDNENNIVSMSSEIEINTCKKDQNKENNNQINYRSEKLPFANELLESTNIKRSLNNENTEHKDNINIKKDECEPSLINILSQKIAEIRFDISRDSYNDSDEDNWNTDAVKY